MTEPIDLPPEIQQVAELLSKERPEVRDLFCYALVLAMIDDEMARITSTRIEGNHEYVTVQTMAGEMFEIPRPGISEEVETQLMERVRAIIAEQDEDGS